MGEHIARGARADNGIRKKLPGHITVIQSWLIATLDRFQLPQTAELKKYFTENLSLLGQLPVSALKTGDRFC